MNQIKGQDLESQYSSRIKERQLRSYTLNIRQNQCQMYTQQKRHSTILQPPDSFRQLESESQKQAQNQLKKNSLVNKQLRIQHKKYYQQQYYDKTSKLRLNSQEKTFIPFIDISQISQKSEPLPIVMNKKNELVKFKSQRPQFSLL